MQNIILNRPAPLGLGIRAAIFDFDGTISTLRCGWEEVMEEVMLSFLRGALPEAELLPQIRAYIDESTGIQTIYQMEWLAERVRALKGEEPLDVWAYKDAYNERLLAMVNGRIDRLEAGLSNPAEFLVPGSREFLAQLSALGVEIYIASGTDDVDLQRECALLGIAPLAKSVKGAPHRRKDCSKEAVIGEILQSLPGERLMVVGDGKVEILLGNAAGAITLGVATDERRLGGQFSPVKLSKLRGAGANYIAADFMALNDWVKRRLRALQTLRELNERHPALQPLEGELLAAFECLAQCYQSGGQVLTCGNGGSASDSEHIVGELMKGFLLKRPLDASAREAIRATGLAPDAQAFADALQAGLPAISLVSQTALMTAFINDVDPSMVFAQQVFAYGRAGDVLIAMSTSGNSKNVVNAAIAAKARGMRVIGLTGEAQSQLSQMSDAILRAPASETFKIQEYHLPLYHALCGMIELEMFDS